MPKLTVFHHCYKIQRWNDVEKSSRLSATHNVGNMMFQLYPVNYYARKNPFDFLLYFYDDIQNRRNRDTSCSGVKRAFLTKLILSRFYEQPWKDLNFLNGYSIGFCVLRSSLTFFSRYHEPPLGRMNVQKIYRFLEDLTEKKISRGTTKRLPVNVPFSVSPHRFIDLEAEEFHKRNPLHTDNRER